MRLALTLRDVRVLRDRLLANDDWDAAGHAYATEHDGYYGCPSQEEWARQLFYGRPEADERRARVFPLLAAESSAHGHAGARAGRAERRGSAATSPESSANLATNRHIATSRRDRSGWQNRNIRARIRTYSVDSTARGAT
ncbi:MAG: hypothetical protein U0232_22980 [Thermomicrobiales bacterium]